VTDYAAIDAVNWSTLKSMAKSPLHYRHRVDTDMDDARHLRLGRAVHTLILEPDQYRERHPVFGGAARRGKAWDDFEAAHPGADILLGTEAAQAEAMAQSVLAHPLARKHLRDGLAEQIMTWTDPETGVKCKGRCDAVNGHLVELKSCNGQAFDPRRFPGHAARLMYHGQIAYYLDGLTAMGHRLDQDPAMIVVESDPPHDVAVYLIMPEDVEAGRELYRSLLDRLVECRRSDRWPGVCEGEELRLRLPDWVRSQFEDDEPITIGGVAMEGF
jgi:hypothetical protein